MKHPLDQVFLLVYATVIYIALPLAIVMGWIRWVRRRTSETPLSWLSLVAFGLSKLASQPVEMVRPDLLRRDSCVLVLCGDE